MIDLYWILQKSESRIRQAMAGWTSGFPLDETAFLNRFSGLYNSAPHCRGGVGKLTSVSTRVFPLHRKGQGGRLSADRYGSDLALTINLNSGINKYLKTAFFQIKKIDISGNVKLEKQQLLDAKAIPQIWDRTFIVGLDPFHRILLLKKASELPPLNKKTKQCSTSDWIDSKGWTEGFLRCSIGEKSSPNLGISVEAQLINYNDKIKRSYVWVEDGSSHNINVAIDRQGEVPLDILPARVWQIVSIDYPQGL